MFAERPGLNPSPSAIHFSLSRLDTPATAPYTLGFALKGKFLTVSAGNTSHLLKTGFVSTELKEEMPNHKSAEKRVRQNEKRRDINRGHRGKLRTGIKKLRAALDGGGEGDAQALLPATISLIDRAVQKGALHRNAAARYKSRLTARANQSAQK